MPRTTSERAVELHEGETRWRDRTLVPYARLRHWLVYWTYRSTHSPAGFPDLWLCRGSVLLVRELKSDYGRPTAAQQEWLDALRAAGVDAQIWRPRMWATIQEELD